MFGAEMSTAPSNHRSFYYTATTLFLTPLFFLAVYLMKILEATLFPKGIAII